MFKCILGSFNSKKKKPVGVFNKTTLDLFNNFVEKLDTIIDRCLKINREYALQKSDLKNFKDYFDSSADPRPNWSFRGHFPHMGW